MLILINKKNNTLSVFKQDGENYVSILKSKELDQTVKLLPVFDDLDNLKIMLSNTHKVIEIKEKIWNSFLDILSLNEYDIHLISNQTSEYKIENKTYITKTNNSIFLINYIYKYFLVNIIKDKNHSLEYQFMFTELCISIYKEIFNLKEIKHVDVI